MNYILVLNDGQEIDLKSDMCTYITVSRFSRNSRNQHCDVVEIISEHKDSDSVFIEVDNMLIPIRSILYIKFYETISEDK